MAHSWFGLASFLWVQITICWLPRGWNHTHDSCDHAQILPAPSASRIAVFFTFAGGSASSATQIPASITMSLFGFLVLGPCFLVSSSRNLFEVAAYQHIAVACPSVEPGRNLFTGRVGALTLKSRIPSVKWAMRQLLTVIPAASLAIHCAILAFTSFTVVFQTISPRVT